MMSTSSHGNNVPQQQIAPQSLAPPVQTLAMPPMQNMQTMSLAAQSAIAGSHMPQGMAILSTPASTIMHTTMPVPRGRGRRVASNGEVTAFIDLNPQDFERQRLEMEANGAKKRTRTLMTPFQNKILRKVLAKTSFPSASLRNSLSQLLGISSRTIQIWFQNQRQKAKQKLNVDMASNLRIQQTFGVMPQSSYEGSLDILANAAITPATTPSPTYGGTALSPMDRSCHREREEEESSVSSMSCSDNGGAKNVHMRPWL